MNGAIPPLLHIRGMREYTTLPYVYCVIVSVLRTYVAVIAECRSRREEGKDNRDRRKRRDALEGR
jgi:hypothetical protein